LGIREVKGPPRHPRYEIAQLRGNYAVIRSVWRVDAKRGWREVTL